MSVICVDDVAELEVGPPEGESTTSVQRALMILDCFALAGPCLGVSEIARLVSMPKSTVFRLLSSLSVRGYVERQGTAYRLGWRMFELGSRATRLDPALRDAVLPYIVDLQARTGHTVHLGVLEGADVVYVEKLHGHKSLRTPTAIGARMPATCAALGKAILAHSPVAVLDGVLTPRLTRRTPYSIAEPGRFVRHLEQIKEHGLAFDKEEAALGLTCAAAPLVESGEAWAALSVSGTTDLLRTRSTLALVADTASRVSSIAEAHRRASQRASRL